MQIGNYQLDNNLILAPMAGITDKPFRNLCKQFGAGLAVSEMVASQPHLRKHHRTLLKADHSDEIGLKSVQILGTDRNKWPMQHVLMQRMELILLILIWAAQLKKFVQSPQVQL